MFIVGSSTIWVSARTGQRTDCRMPRSCSPATMNGNRTGVMA